MRLIPLYLIPILAACSADDRAPGDAGADRSDAHLLRFDAGADAETPDGFVASDTGTDAEPTADSGADTAIPTDALPADAPWWEQTDTGPQCDGGAVDCDNGTMCGVCLGACIEGRMPPDYCYTLQPWQYAKHCLLSFQCAV